MELRRYFIVLGVGCASVALLLVAAFFIAMVICTLKGQNPWGC